MFKLNWAFCLFIFLFSYSTNAQNDCSDAIVVCGNSGFQGLTATGFGIQELNGLTTCQSQENNSIWLKLSINTSGTLGFELIPESSSINIDFDFFIFGPNATCSNLGQSIRCSTTNPQSINQDNNHTGLDFIETDTSEGPGNAGNSFLRWLDVNAGETYFLVLDRPIGSSNFSLTWSGTAIFNTPPVLNIPSGNGINLKECDNDGNNNNSTAFNLTQNTPIIKGSQTDVEVKYFSTLNGALTGLNPISNPTTFVNTTNPETVFVRITNTLTGCFNNSDFQIEVNNSIVFPKSEVAICDDATDGNETNGRTTFNLNAVSNVIFDNQDISGYTISYHLTQNEATNNTNSLPLNFYNTIPNQQDIFIRATNSVGCFGIQAVKLIVLKLPPKINSNLTQCDSGLNPDGFSSFNLLQANNSFLNNDANLTVKYFADALSEQNNIELPTIYTNITNPQNILARVKNTSTGCYSISNLILNVNVVPGQIVAPLKKCDILNQENGIAKFDLSLANLTITPTQVVTFYPNLNDAILEQNQVANTTTYENENPYISEIYARIEDNNNCSGISKITLIVDKLPIIEDKNDQNYFICTNFSNQFININPDLKNENENNFTYEWFLDNNPIPFSTYSIALDKAGVYTVKVSNSNLCSKIQTIEVLESSIAMIQKIEIEDFIVENNTIKIILQQGSRTFEYKLDDGAFQTSDQFLNVLPGIHTVFIKDINGCGTISKKVAVIGAPKYFTPNGDGFNDFWKIEGLTGIYYSKTKIYIFDKYGKLIKDLNAFDTDGWNGKLNNEVLPADDYWYSVDLEDGRSTKGHFTLKR